MVKRNVFITYHHADQTEVYDFVALYGDWFNSMRVLGVSDEDAFVDSANTDYVLRRIREEYMYGTSVTVALIGACSWARKYVDWEIAATLRNNPNDPRGALLAMQLPCIDGRNDITLPKPSLRPKTRRAPKLCRGWSGRSSVFVDESVAACRSDDSKLLLPAILSVLPSMCAVLAAA